VSNASTSSSKNSYTLADYDAVFAAVDNAARRQILLILHFRGDEMTSGEIADRFSCTWATTSRHLRKLESCGLVTVERSGREWIYRLNRAAAERGRWGGAGGAGGGAKRTARPAARPRSRPARIR
jgi:DNA-binding transcriptional ArsR family regulator